MGSIPHGGIFLSFVFLFLKVNIILKHFCLRLHDIGTISEGSEDHIFVFCDLAGTHLGPGQGHISARVPRGDVCARTVCVA